MDDSNKNKNMDKEQQNHFEQEDDGLRIFYNIFTDETLEWIEKEDPDFRPDPRTQSLIERIDREQRKRGIIPKSEREDMNTKK